jgi:hypothetical protein
VGLLETEPKVACMLNMIRPASGVIIGVIIIIFSSQISRYITWAYQKDPKYKAGANSFGIDFNIRPFFIGLLGLVIIIFSTIGIVLAQL